VAAGIPSEFIAERLGATLPVVRAMPNTPALVDEGITAISAGAHADDQHMARAEELFTPVGHVLRVAEYQQNAVAAISGSGPAYIFLLVEALIDAGVYLGLSRQISSELVTQTTVGAAALLKESGDHPVVLREGVTSPGGTTIRAIREFEKHGLRAAVFAAIEAAKDRSVELGDELSGA
jgi:pyrroline-5-carboxylate reductase